MIHVKKILYPTDFSSYSNQAYFHVLGLAQTYGASLTIVYVHRRVRAKGRVARSTRTGPPANPKIPVSHVLLEGDPASEIARYAADANIDVIVIGTHGRTGVDRLVMGSVAEPIWRGALLSSSSSCPRASSRPASPSRERLTNQTKLGRRTISHPPTERKPVIQSVIRRDDLAIGRCFARPTRPGRSRC